MNHKSFDNTIGKANTFKVAKEYGIIKGVINKAKM